MAERKVMSHNARVNDALVELMEGVKSQHQLDADFWVAVREDIFLSGQFGVRYDSSTKAKNTHQKRLERMSRSGRDSLVNNGIIQGTWRAVSSHVGCSGEVPQNEVDGIRSNLEIALK